MRLTGRFGLWFVVAFFYAWVTRSWFTAKLGGARLDSSLPLLLDCSLSVWLLVHGICFLRSSRLTVHFFRVLSTVLLSLNLVMYFFLQNEALFLLSVGWLWLLEALFTVWLPKNWRQIEQVMCWYQGARERIQGLLAYVQLPDGPLPVAVQSINPDGAVLAARPELLEVLNYSPLIVQFFFRNRSMICTGSAMVQKHKWRGPYPLGVSLRFTHEHADARKNLGDFLELLKGAGYGQPT